MSWGGDSAGLAELDPRAPKDEQEDEDVLDTLRSPHIKENMRVPSQAIHSD